MKPKLRKVKQILLNETGQMSIFIALIFQVLFVFFAMVINIGLLVHDKINLQNAVDLGAYYGAQKQAEILNEISHVNFQIRQDYKLLAWRFRVMGTLGRIGTSAAQNDSTFPPALRSSAGGLTDKKFVNPAYGDEKPSVCVSNNYWTEFVANSSQEENYCFKPYNTPTPLIPSVQVIASFVPGVTASADFTKQAQAAQLQACRQAGPLNWAFLMQMIYAYKLGIATRKQVIWEMRKNLISKDMKDRSGNPVFDGIKQTISKNLTQANRDQLAFEKADFMNGLSDQNCNKGDDGEFVIPEIKTYPVLFYTWIDPDNCQSRIVDHHTYDQLDGQELNKWDPSNLMRYFAQGEPDPKRPEHSSLGFEKNPWCMSYVGVRATTKTYKPFAPFGKEIELSARSFAQPFGGRIGPWYQERWSKGASTSNQGDRVDPLTTKRLIPGTQEQIGAANVDAYVPNYSRFPGDTIGVASELSMGAQNSVIRGIANSSRDQKFHLVWYGNFGNIPTSGDVLVQAGAPDALRKAEISAVTPDLFDTTYYSIDPQYGTNYVTTSGAGRFSGIQPLFGQQVKQIGDIGAGTGGLFSVEDQIKASLSGGFDSSVLGKLTYPLRQWEHLLTAWAPNRVQNFEFPAERFGICGKAADKVMIPGKCVAGGRTGYSVRLVSRAHLTFSGWKIGGDNEAEGPILNPPPTSF